MKSILKKLLIISIILGAVIAYWAYSQIWKPNTPTLLDNVIIEIPAHTTFEKLTTQLVNEKFILDAESFRRVARLMKFDQRDAYSGRYEIQGGWNNRTLVSHLRSGKQAAINVTINNVRTIADMAGKVSKYIQPDSIQLLQYLTNNKNLTKWGYSQDDILTLFIPNTYQLYWDTTPKEFVARMQSEYDKYWKSKGREASIKSYNLTKKEAYSLAAIIEKETTNSKERATISGVYHNRLQRDIALQADPTVVFAVGDFSIRRVLNKHLTQKSPYNTYLHTGLPPGPIYMPTLASLDAAIFPEDHEYIFFCAKPGYENEHAFAKTLRAHNRNASIFHSWLNKEGIRK